MAPWKSCDVSNSCWGMHVDQNAKKRTLLLSILPNEAFDGRSNDRLTFCTRSQAKIKLKSKLRKKVVLPCLSWIHHQCCGKLSSVKKGGTKGAISSVGGVSHNITEWMAQVCTNGSVGARSTSPFSVHCGVCV